MFHVKHLPKSPCGGGREDPLRQGGEGDLSVWELLGLWFWQHRLLLLAALAGVVLLSGFAAAVAALVRTRRLEERYRRLMMGRDDLDLEELLSHHGELIGEAKRHRLELALRLQELEGLLQLTVAGVGLVRYNAFRETGSDLSYSLALLDSNLDGVVLTSLFGRDESRCYGKPVQRGRSSHHLSEEENRALEEAVRKINSGSGRVSEGGA